MYHCYYIFLIEVKEPMRTHALTPMSVLGRGHPGSNSPSHPYILEISGCFRFGDFACKSTQIGLKANVFNNVRGVRVCVYEKVLTHLHTQSSEGGDA